MSQISLQMPVLVILSVLAMTVIAKSDNFSGQQPIEPQYLGHLRTTGTDEANRTLTGDELCSTEVTTHVRSALEDLNRLRLIREDVEKANPCVPVELIGACATAANRTSHTTTVAYSIAFNTNVESSFSVVVIINGTDGGETASYNVTQTSQPDRFNACRPAGANEHACLCLFSEQQRLIEEKHQAAKVKDLIAAATASQDMKIGVLTRNVTELKAGAAKCGDLTTVLERQKVSMGETIKDMQQHIDKMTDTVTYLEGQMAGRNGGTDWTKLWVGIIIGLIVLIMVDIGSEMYSGKSIIQRGKLAITR